ncbi:hypothetical protein J6590_028775 [Homalodisca vitripennis]|nr:hypothetical protein J6590_028775 [Homalodisca vitripennis]
MIMLLSWQANGIENTDEKILMKDMLSLLNKTQLINLTLGTIPMRNDIFHIDTRISTVNSKLERTARENSRLKLLPLHLMPIHMFTTHDLHLSRRGKSEESGTYQVIDQYPLQESSPVLQQQSSTVTDLMTIPKEDNSPPVTPNSSGFLSTDHNPVHHVPTLSI